MRYLRHWRLLLVLLVISLGSFKSGFSQSTSEIENGKKEYEKNNPNEKTYLVGDLVAILDPADSIMPNAKSVTHKRWEQIGGAMFGVVTPFNRKGRPAKDEFTIKYFKDDPKFKGLVMANILTDATAFQKFMEEHQANGFYKVSLWKAGYLMFYILEGREKKQGLNLVVVPVKSQLYKEL